MTVEDAVHEQNAEEHFRTLMQHCCVLGTHVLSAAEPIFDRCPSVITPSLRNLQRRTTDMENEGYTGFGQTRPKPFKIHMTR